MRLTPPTKGTPFSPVTRHPIWGSPKFLEASWNGLKVCFSANYGLRGGDSICRVPSVYLHSFCVGHKQWTVLRICINLKTPHPQLLTSALSKCSFPAMGCPAASREGSRPVSPCIPTCSVQMLTLGPVPDRAIQLPAASFRVSDISNIWHCSFGPLVLRPCHDWVGHWTSLQSLMLTVTHGAIYFMTWDSHPKL